MDFASKKTKTNELITKAVIVGAVAAAGSMLLLGENRNISVFSLTMPSAIPTFAAAAAGSIAADMAHDYLLPMIPANDPKYLQVETIGLGIATSGIATWGAMSLLTGGADPMYAIGIGAGSYVAGDWAWNQVLDTSSGGLVF